MLCPSGCCRADMNVLATSTLRDEGKAQELKRYSEGAYISQCLV